MYFSGRRGDKAITGASRCDLLFATTTTKRPSLITTVLLVLHRTADQVAVCTNNVSCSMQNVQGKIQRIVCVKHPIFVNDYLKRGYPSALSKLDPRTEALRVISGSYILLLMIDWVKMKFKHRGLCCTTSTPERSFVFVNNFVRILQVHQNAIL